jgi:hypothetical protein
MVTTSSQGTDVQTDPVHGGRRLESFASLGLPSWRLAI